MKQTLVPATINCPAFDEESGCQNAYIELLKRCLTNLIYAESEIHPKDNSRKLRRNVTSLVNRLIFNEKEQLLIVDTSPVDVAKRIDGSDWPPSAHTMVGLMRLNNVQFCLESIFKDKVPGDIIEAGVWRGGTSILMRALLKVHGESERKLWLADSFAGLPPPNEEKYPADKGDGHYHCDFLAVSLEQVKANFERYGLLDDGVGFLKGWFSETLPHFDGEKLALIRADGDMYESTMDILNNLYHKLSIGGYIIIDDFGALTSCRTAVDDFRKEHGIVDEIHQVDWTGAYWRKSH